MRFEIRDLRSETRQAGKERNAKDKGNIPAFMTGSKEGERGSIYHRNRMGRFVKGEGDE